MEIFGIHLDDDLLSSSDLGYLKRWSNTLPPPVEEIWAALDIAWDESWAHRVSHESDAMRLFYDHPVWLLNGVFTEVDEASIGHREAIANDVAARQPDVVCDFGGGFGALARRMAGLMPMTRIAVVEPYPRPVALALAKPYSNLAYVSELPAHTDVVIAQDVLEHVPNPIDLTAKLISQLKSNGVFIAANCFQPVIKCHLPETFHLLQTFRHCVAPLGLDFDRTIAGAPHAEIFLRNSRSPNLSRAHRREWASRQIAPISRKLQRWASRLL